MPEPIDREKLYARLMVVLTRHVGKHNAIGMAELYQAVTGETWSNRINDTRLLRRIVTYARHQGDAICSDNTGYWLSQAGSDVEDYIARLKKSALKKLLIVSRMKKTALPKLCGQLEFDVLTEAVEAEQREAISAGGAKL